MKSPYVSRNLNVLDALDEELEYIENLPRRTADNGVAGQLTTLRTLLVQADAAWTNNAGDEAALDIVRKIAGASIRALILYGCPRRHVPLKVYPGGGNTPIVDESHVGGIFGRREGYGD